MEVRSVWEIYDDRLQFMSRQDALLLSESLLRLLLQMLIVFLVVLPLVKVWFLGVVWLVSSVFGLEVIRFEKFRCNAVDVHDAADVFLYRGSSISPLLDMRRRFKAVMDVLDAMIRYGISCSVG